MIGVTLTFNSWIASSSATNPKLGFSGLAEILAQTWLHESDFSDQQPTCQDETGEMMSEVRIINDSEAITQVLQRELLELGIEYRTTPWRDVQVPSASLEDRNVQLIFLAVDAVQEKHSDVLRKLRADSNSGLVVVSTTLHPDVMLNLIRIGINDVLKVGDDLGREIADTLSRIKPKSSARTEAGRTITVLPTGSTADSSMLSTCLAAIIAKAFKFCGLIDMHLLGGDMAEMLKISPQHTLFDLLKCQDGIDRKMTEQAILKHKCGIHLLASPPLFSNLTEINAAMCCQVVQHFRDSHPYTVIHADNPSYPEQLIAMLESEAIIITTRLDLPSVSRTQQTMRYLLRSGIAASDVHVVAMRTGCPAQLPAKAVKELLKLDRLFDIPDDSSEMTMSINIGNPLVIESPQSLASIKINEMAQMLIEIPGDFAPRSPWRVMPNIVSSKIRNRLSSILSN